jgi:hypothetical protein
MFTDTYLGAQKKFRTPVSGLENEIAACFIAMPLVD